MKPANLEACEAALNDGCTVYTLNPQRGWVPASVIPLRRAIEWHKTEAAAGRRWQWRTDLYRI